MNICPIPDARLVEDLRSMASDFAEKPMHGWERNRCNWAADRIEALEAALTKIKAIRAPLLPDRAWVKLDEIVETAEAASPTHPDQTPAP